eukprot:COSAG04_NODE_5130_length_1725_cov_17.753998_1_plen_137_part_00
MQLSRLVFAIFASAQPRPPPTTTTTWAFRRATWGWAGGGKCPCGLKYVVLRLKRNLPLWPKRGVVFFPNQRYEDRSSRVVDPQFERPPDNLLPRPTSPAAALGFEPIDVGAVGVSRDALLARMRLLPPAVFGRYPY